MQYSLFGKAIFFNKNKARYLINSLHNHLCRSNPGWRSNPFDDFHENLKVPGNNGIMTGWHWGGTLGFVSPRNDVSLKAQVFLPKQILFQTSPQQNSQLSHRWPLTSFAEVFPKFLSLSGTPCWLHGGSLQRFCLAAPTTRCQCCVCGKDAKNLEVLYHAFTWPGEKVGVGVLFLGGGFK